MFKSLNFKSWKGVAAGTALVLLLAAPAVYAQNSNATELSPEAAVESAVSSTVPRVVTSRVKSVSMFKNGVALIREEFSVPTSGQYVLDAIPYAIHGAFFIQSDADVEAVLTQRQSRESVGASGDLDYQKDLVGKKVRVFFNNANLPPVHGTVAAVRQTTPEERAPQSASDFRQGYYYPGYYYNRGAYETPEVSNSHLILNTDFGQTVIQQSSIARIDVEGEIGTVVRSRPTLLFKVKTEKPAVVGITYLTKGAAWAPAYRILLPDDKSNRGKMTIEQTATIVNQWRDFSGAQIYLISGYPKIGCENVISPISNKANLSAFFSQMLRPDSDDHGNMMSQMVMNSSNPNDSNEFPSGAVAASGDGPDIYYHLVGQRSMNKGDVLALSNGKKETEYERVVEWTVSDTRNENGHPIGDNQNPNTPWDTIQFVNPFEFPMTTGPAAIMTEHKFLGQNTSYWTSPGEKTSIPITKSLSVSVKADEQEINRSDEMQYMGVRCRRITVAVELSIANRRAEPIKALVKRQFSGEIEMPVEGAKVVQLNQDLNALNRQNELRWELTLNPGETRTLKYEYELYMSY